MERHALAALGLYARVRAAVDIASPAEETSATGNRRKKAAWVGGSQRKICHFRLLGMRDTGEGAGDSPVLIGGGFRLPPEWTVRVSYLRRRPRVGVAILILLAPVAVQLCLDRLGYFPQIFRVGTVPCPNGSHRLPQNGASD